VIGKGEESKLPYEVDFRHQFVSEFVGDSRLSEFDQDSDIGGSCTPSVYHDIGMFREDLGSSVGLSLEPALVYEASGADSVDFLED
tara:strand:+ start:283 stop:540 length:258 start_codon:yes stop_codon:yes gene_type:complete